MDELRCDIFGYLTLHIFAAYLVLLVPFALSRYFPICHGSSFTYTDAAIPLLLANILLATNFAMPLILGSHYVVASAGGYCAIPWYETKLQYLIPTVLYLVIWFSVFCIIAWVYYQ
jgi:hypothetical protein